MYLKKAISTILFTLISFIICAQSTSLKILVFSKTAGWRHESIPAGKKLFTELGAKNNWHVDIAEDASNFNSENLKVYKTIVFLNTTGNILDENQQKALQNYISNGGGFVGIHAAADTEKEWPWFTEMIGATFKSHPEVQTATLQIDKTSKHPAINHLNDNEVFKDEWYNFLKPVGKHVNVLASLNENSYTGERMNTENHPITWYHHYDGGRVFYTGLGHTNEAYSDKRFKKLIEGAVLWTAGLENIKAPSSKKWTYLFEGDSSKNWDVFIGAPHASVKGLDNVDPNSDGMNSSPLGLNNDPKKVFTFEKENGKNVLHISGEVYGALTTKQEYKNYHLKIQFKWGEEVWEPRLKASRDSGILYHCKGAYSGFWNVWMASQEFQVQEGDVGDYYGIVNTLTTDIPSEKNEDGKEYVYNKNAILNSFSSLEEFPAWHCNKGANNEKPHGEWNTLELICFEGTSLHIVNGKVVMALYNSKHQNENGEISPLDNGRIQIQSEAAEVYYKNAQIKSINKIPSKFLKQTKL